MYTQAEVLAKMINGKNLFISGKGGAGKSTLIKIYENYIKNETDKQIELTATTGKAATIINGRTIHSVAGLGIGATPMIDRLTVLKNRSDVMLISAKKRLRTTDILVVDEISALSEAMFTDLIVLLEDVNKFREKKDKQPIQLLLFGDFNQLPPVPSERVGSGSLCFECEVWKSYGIENCYLDRVYRQSEDDTLYYVLENIINQENIDNIPEMLEQRVTTKGAIEEMEIPYLMPTNRQADSYNAFKQDNNPNPAKVFRIEKDSQYRQRDNEDLIKRHQLEEKLILKEGDIIIVTSNDNYVNSFVIGGEGQPQLTNGTVGKFIDSAGDYMYIEVAGEFYKLARLEYTMTTVDKASGEEVEKARVLQFPVKLAYAISIHKAQGQTYTKLATELHNAWMHNLGYVALSRARSFDGLHIVCGYNGVVFSDKAFRLSEASREIYNTLTTQENIDESEEEIKKAQKIIDDYLKELQDE